MANMKRRIIVIDDSSEICTVLQQVLIRKGGYEVETVLDSLQAEKKIREFAPDLAIVDLFMPNKDGASIINAMQNDSLMKDIKIIAMSGRLKEEVDEILAGLRIDAFLEKPFSFELLLDVVEKILEE